MRMNESTIRASVPEKGYPHTLQRHGDNPPGSLIRWGQGCPAAKRGSRNAITILHAYRASTVPGLQAFAVVEPSWLKSNRWQIEWGGLSKLKLETSDRRSAPGVEQGHPPRYSSSAFATMTIASGQFKNSLVRLSNHQGATQGEIHKNIGL